MKIYAAYTDYKGRDSQGYDIKLKRYHGFYKKEINCLRACVKQGWECEEIELEDTCPEDVYNATVKGILPKDMRFA